jgi:fermentation-respiration switch protein FrsA (DUF1100 family)
MSVQLQFTSLKDVRRKQKKKPALIIFNSVLALVISFNLLMLYTGNIFYEKAFLVETKKELDQYDSNKIYFSEQRFNTLRREDVSISSKYDYKLYGTYIRNAKTTKDTMILIHGLGGSRWTELKYVDMYLDKGFNILIYDGRAHGFSGGDNVTYGFYEAADLDKWVNWIYTKNKGGLIGVHGDSMGAATALLHSKINETKGRVNFYISDSAYSDINELFTYRLRQDYNIKVKFVSKVLLFYVDKVNKLRNGFNLVEASPKNAIKDVQTPILFIHGEKDTFVLKEMTENLYGTKTGEKMLYISPNASHVQSYLTNSNEYMEKVYDFIDNTVLK